VCTSIPVPPKSASREHIAANAANVHLRNTFNQNVFGTPVTAVINNLASTSGSPGADDNFCGFNPGLNKSGRYSYGYLSSSPATIDPAKGDFISATGYFLM
jgi:hypothetical protein